MASEAADLIEELAGEIEARDVLTAAGKKELSRTIAQNLKKCTQDELYEFAIECDAEEGPGHCWRCKAWSLWVDRAEAKS